MTEDEFRAGLLYRYRAQVLRPLDDPDVVRDGDTFRVRLSLGLDLYTESFWVRPTDYDAPEITGATRPWGLAARDHLILLLSDIRYVYLQTLVNPHGRARTSFDRYLARVWLPADGGELVLLGDRMRSAGMTT